MADHKYDKDGRLARQVQEFLRDTFPSEQTRDLIANAIDRISYSKENRAREAGEPLDWERVLGREGMEVRNYVSDADKLEALGEIGMKRCLEYAAESLGTKDSRVLLRHLEEHAEEKLFRLKDQFIRTPAGKKRAEKLHWELAEAIKRHRNEVQKENKET